MVHIQAKIERILAAFLIAAGACTALVATGIIPAAGLKPGPLRDPGRWNVVFEDDFGGTTLNLSRWSYNYPVDWPHGGHTHNHEAYMAEENVLVEGGLLRIKGENRRHPSAPPPEESPWGWLSYNFTAGAINILGKFSAKYGYFEARMKFPEGPTGFWPARSAQTLPSEGFVAMTPFYQAIPPSLVAVSSIKADPWQMCSQLRSNPVYAGLNGKKPDLIFFPWPLNKRSENRSIIHRDGAVPGAIF
nr:hypothetical protein [Candidatus Sigynarchaeum springense]